MRVRKHKKKSTKKITFAYVLVYITPLRALLVLCTLRHKQSNLDLTLGMIVSKGRGSVD